MIVVIRNAAGIDVYLAIDPREDGLRIQVTLHAPQTRDHVERLRPGQAFGIPGCPEGLGVKVRCPSETLHAAKRREVVDRLDADGELDGEETYLEFVIRFLN
jgi:hypothetical protein